MHLERFQGSRAGRSAAARHQLAGLGRLGDFSGDLGREVGTRKGHRQPIHIIKMTSATYPYHKNDIGNLSISKIKRTSATYPYRKSKGHRQPIHIKKVHRRIFDQEYIGTIDRPKLPLSWERTWIGFSCDPGRVPQAMQPAERSPALPWRLLPRLEPAAARSRGSTNICACGTGRQTAKADR